MRVAFRVDASLTIGTGHLRRCLSLASALTELGAEVRLVVRRLDETAAVALGYGDAPVHWLAEPLAPLTPTPASAISHEHWAGVDWRTDAEQTCAELADHAPDWVVIDHYSFDSRWHEHVRGALGCRIAAIDDLADRQLSVDVLLDANFAEDHALKYETRLDRRCRLLGGPRFALLNSAYRTAPRYAFSPDVRSIGVFMGGTDPDGVSARVLYACRDEGGFQGSIEVVSTSANPRLEALRNLCAAVPGTTLSLDLPDLAPFYARHDLQIGAGGTATYERCCIGAPTIALAVASNQLAVIPALASMGVLRAARLPGAAEANYFGQGQSLGEAVRDLTGNPEARRSLSDNGMRLVDARGGERVALCLLGTLLGLRRATIEDGDLLHGWRNHPSTRAVSGNGDAIGLSQHLVWLSRKLAAEDSRLYVAEIGGLPVGIIRFDRVDDGYLEVSLYLDPDLTGLGLGPGLLLGGEREAFKAWPDAPGFVASVLPGNEVSARLFVSCGYSGGPLVYNKSATVQEI